MVSPDSTIAPPLVTTLTLTNRNMVAYSKLDITIDGAIALSENGPPEPIAETSYTVTLPTAGTYSVGVRIRDSNNTLIYSATRMVNVGDPAKLDALLRGVYTGMLDNLRVGNMNRALGAVTDIVYEKYEAIFTKLGPNLMSIVDQLGSFADATVGDDLAEYSIIRDTPTGPMRFLIYLLRGPDGVWRIEGM